MRSSEILCDVEANGTELVRAVAVVAPGRGKVGRRTVAGVAIVRVALDVAGTRCGARRAATLLDESAADVEAAAARQGPRVDYARSSVPLRQLFSKLTVRVVRSAPRCGRRAPLLWQQAEPSVRQINDDEVPIGEQHIADQSAHAVAPVLHVQAFGPLRQVEDVRAFQRGTPHRDPPRLGAPISTTS